MWTPTLRAVDLPTHPFGRGDTPSASAVQGLWSQRVLQGSPRKDVFQISTMLEFYKSQAFFFSRCRSTSSCPACRCVGSGRWDRVQQGVWELSFEQTGNSRESRLSSRDANRRARAPGVRMIPTGAR
eukprot:gene14559-biopygen6591